MTTKPTLSFADYSMLVESLDLDVGEVKNDPGMERMAKSMLHPSMADSVSVTYNKHMDANNLRLIKFKNQRGEVEYHIHNMTMMPGLKSDNVSKLGFMSIAKMIHQDGLKEIEKGNTLRFQSVEGSHQHAKYKSIIERIAKTAGKTVKHAGLLPITSAPFLRGETMLIESILVESPALGLNIDRNDSRDMMRTKIAEVEPHARKLTDTLHMHSYPGTNQHLFFHKSDVGIPHSGSLFTQNDSMMIHNMVDRVDHPNADYIHKTIQHLVDSGFEVVSDSKQSTGGRSLWTNIHKNVNFTNAAVMNSQGRSPVDNFEKFKDVDDAKTRFSIWKD